jgi:hypothetical protein
LANTIFVGQNSEFCPAGRRESSEKHVLRDVQGGQYSAIIVPNGAQWMSILGRPACEADDAEILRGQRGTLFLVQNSLFSRAREAKALGYTSVVAN